MKTLRVSAPTVVFSEPLPSTITHLDVTATNAPVDVAQLVGNLRHLASCKIRGLGAMRLPTEWTGTLRDLDLYLRERNVCIALARTTDCSHVRQV